MKKGWQIFPGCRMIFFQIWVEGAGLRKGGLLCLGLYDGSGCRLMSFDGDVCWEDLITGLVTQQRT